MSPPADCPAALERLHARLDGDQSALPESVRIHLDACATCRERFRAAEVLLGLKPAALFTPRPLTERVVAAVELDAARRRYTRRAAWAGSAALAASVAAWFGIRPPQPTDARHDEPDRPEVVAAVAPPAFAVGEVGGAVASLSRRTAADIAEQGRLLLPEVTVPATLPAIDATARPLDEARNGLAEGFEPVTTSARRAFGLLNAFAVETRN